MSRQILLVPSFTRPWGMLRYVGWSLATLMLSGVCGLYLLYTRAFIYAGYIFVIPMSLVSSGR